MDFTQAAQAHAFRVRPALPVEARAVRILCPEITAAARQVVSQVAVAGEPEKVIGAAALVLDGRYNVAHAQPIDVHVIPPCRRLGVGRALVEAIVAEARGRSIANLDLWHWADPDSHDQKTWAGLGFLPWQWRYEYTGDIAQSLETVRPLVNRLRERGKIPANARVMSLGEADVEQVARLHATYLGGTVDALRPLLDGSSPEGFDTYASVVATVDDRVVAFSIGRPHPDEPGTHDYDSVVADPTVRGSWAIPLLREHHCMRTLEVGSINMRYFALSQHQDTQNASERFGNPLVSTKVRLRRALAEQPQ